MNINLTLTTSEAWIVRDLLNTEIARLNIAEKDLQGERFNEYSLQTIESNKAIIKSTLEKIFTSKSE